MGRPSLTIEQRWDKLRSRLQLPNGTETELKELEKEERALSAQIKYKNDKGAKNGQSNTKIYNLPDVFEVTPLSLPKYHVVEWQSYYAVVHEVMGIIMDGMSKTDADEYAADLNKSN